MLLGTCAGCQGPGLSGGAIPGGDPDWPPAANITKDDATGLGAWSRADFDRAMRRGKRPGDGDINPVMPWKAYAGLTEQDMSALWLAIRAASAKTRGGR